MHNHLVCFPVFHHGLGALDSLTNYWDATKTRREVWWPSEERKGASQERVDGDNEANSGVKWGKGDYILL